MTNQDNSSIESVLKKLRQEQFDAMERSFKTEERKILFVLALFGLGGYGYNQDIIDHFGYLYYLIPFIAVAFDAVILRQTYSVRRIGAFLRDHSETLEREWECFVNENRKDNYLRFGIDGFTLLAFAAPIWLIFKYIHHGVDFPSIKDFWNTFNNMEKVWFLSLFITALVIRYRSIKKLDEFEYPKDQLVSKFKRFFIRLFKFRLTEDKNCQENKEVSKASKE